MLGGWRACLLIAATYFHFLIFAQFAFLSRLAAWSPGGASLKPAMGAMALGGILFSLLTAYVGVRIPARLRIRISLAACAITAFAATFDLSYPLAVLLSFAIGASLAVLTVTMASELKQWLGSRAVLVKIGIGTGFGYWLANLPLVFTASAQQQALFCGLACLVALLFAPRSITEAEQGTERHEIAPWVALTIFLALVWLDSAAFYVIQHTDGLKSGSWQGSTHLWNTGALHLLAAIVSGMLLQRFRAYWTLCVGFGLLAAACLLLQDRFTLTTAWLLYPCGVSLYSVALVAFPSVLLGREATAQQRARVAGWFYAVAGWIGSAMGIGMAEHLHLVPPGFVLAAGVVVLAPALIQLFRQRAREVAAILAVAGLTLFASQLQKAPPTAASDAVAQGRAVYVAEGCIHCHSQYVRPGTADVLLWGPVKPVAEVHQETPPLIGNRRQGPDLAEVGARRSALWLKLHFMDPAALSAGSIMPTYALLFRDGRGDNLVAYLGSLRRDDQQLDQQRRQWTPLPAAWQQANAAEGQRLYAGFCATCHSASGVAQMRWHAEFQHEPQDFAAGAHAFRLLHPESVTPEQVARIVKFGMPGTDMPGHEVLADQEVASISLWLAQAIAQPPNNHPHPSVP
jgi:cytochrome c oxidase cbb3-type subunit 2